MAEYKAFTLTGNGGIGRFNVLRTKCRLSTAFDPKLGKPKDLVLREYMAIWDTGATGTVITSKAAKELGLIPSGKVTSNHAGGSSVVPTYLINVYLPNGISIAGVRVIEAVLSGDTEILIGMDIISLGDFSYTNVNGNSCFSFRIPSIKKIDYVKEYEDGKNKKKPKWLKPSRGGYKKGRKK